MEGNPNLSGEDESFDEFNSVDEHSFPQYTDANAFLSRNSGENSRENSPSVTHKASKDAQMANDGKEDSAAPTEPIITDEDIYWSLDECEKLVDLVLENPDEPHNWEVISEKMGKSIEVCISVSTFKLCPL